MTDDAARPTRGRDEQRTRTRAELLDAAATIFARSGYHGASLDEIAEAAGFTKGAIYSNFRSKEELFLALLDRHHADALASFDEILECADPEQRPHQLAERREKLAVFDRDWLLLETEFALYAARNEDVRERLVERQQAMRAALAQRLARHVQDVGGTLCVDAEVVARLLAAASDGLILHQLADPGGDDTGTLLTTLLEVVLRGATSG